MSGLNLIAINKYGRVIGLYVPLERDEHEVRDAWAAAMGDNAPLE